MGRMPPGKPPTGKRRAYTGRPKTGRTEALRVYVHPEFAQAIREEARERELTQGQIVEEAYSSRARLIYKPPPEGSS